MTEPVPLVSVVVPIYNHAAYVEACLDSVASQDHQRIEVVAIDDGSADASLDRASAWFAAHGHRFERWLLDSQPNAGITPTFNRLVRRSQGDFVFPLASDDLAADGAIAALVAFHRAHCPRPTLVFSDVLLIDAGGDPYSGDDSQLRRRRRDWLAASPEFLASELLFDWGTPFQHQFYPRALYEEFGGYDESLKIEDLAFALRAAARGAVRYAPLVSRHYRMRAGGSATPGVAALDWTGVPSRRAVRAEFGLLDRRAIDLLDKVDLLPEGRPRRVARRRLRRLRRLRLAWLRLRGRLPEPD